MSLRGDRIGVEVADALGRSPTDELRDAKRDVWRRVCNALDPYLLDSWLDIYADPTLENTTMPDGSPVEPKTVAWQIAGGLPVAIWVKFGLGMKDWDLIWPVGGGRGFGILRTAYEIDFTTLTPQNLLTGGDGAKTIGGKPWTLAQSGRLAVAALNGGTYPGIYLKCNTEISVNSQHVLNGGALYTPIPTLSDALAVNARPQIAETWLWVLGSVPHAPTADFESTHVGLIWSVQSYTYNGLVKFSIGDGANSLDSPTKSYGRTQFSVGGNDTYGEAREQVQYGAWAFRILPGEVECYTTDAPGDGSFPDIKALKFRGRAPFIAYDGVPGEQHGNAKEFYNVWFSVMSGNTLGHQDLVLRKMRIQYLPTAMGSAPTPSTARVDEPFFPVGITDGVLGDFGGHRNLLVTGSGPLVGIPSASLIGGEKLSLTFTADTTITAMGSPSSGSKIKTPRMGDPSPQDIHLKADDTVEVQFRIDTTPTFWKVIGGSYA
jgi:hypothetical protein